MMYRVVFPAELLQRLNDHLQLAAPREEGAFLLLHLGRGLTSTRLLVHDLLFPPAGAWESQGHDRLRPSAQWLSAVLGAAIEGSSGFAFIHSHPGTHHPPSLSPIDRSTSIGLSKSLCPMTGQPFASLVWSPGGISGWVFEPGSAETPHDIDQVDVLGQGQVRTLNAILSVPVDEVLDDRQIRALGTLGNARLRRLRVAVVGAGGTGSPVAEQLARMGVAEITLIDPDTLDTPSNLRRVVGSYPSDMGRGRKKVSIVGQHLERLDLGSLVRPIPFDVRHQTAARGLLDADLVINTTDSQSSRAFLNQLAFQYWLPVVDVGVRVGTAKSGQVSGMPAEVRVLLPDTGCLWCRGVLDAGVIRAENLPSDERAHLAQEGYIQGLLGPQPSLIALNYFAAALVVLAALRLYSDQPTRSPSFLLDGWELYVHFLGSDIDMNCLCHRWRGLGDLLPITFLPSTELQANDG